jgi:UDP:flavonoid glycosyltransferase YjiC (YdhE family)
MRVLLTTYGSRGDVEPMIGLAVQLRALGAQVRVCAPRDEEFAELLARVGVPLVPFDRPWRSWERPSTAEARTQRVTEFIDAQYDTVAQAADGCDVLLATRSLPAELVAFLDAGTPPVYVGFGSMRVAQESARAAIAAIRAHGRRALVARGWVDLA